MASTEVGPLIGAPGLRSGITALAILGALYIGALVWADQRNEVFAALPRLASAMPLLAACSFLAYLIRFARWRWLLARSNSAIPPVRGFLAYVAGFALTASPGKVGELLRIRYYTPMGVPAKTVIACFVYERILDLVILLALASPLVWRAPGFSAGIGLVGLAIVAIAVAVRWPQLRYHPIRALRRVGLRAPARWLRILGSALGSIAEHTNAATLALAVTLGLAAWMAQTAGFIFLAIGLGLDLPAVTLAPIMPAASLIGAASALPGGVGATEASMVGILRLYDVAFDLAVLVAVGFRLGSIWFAMVVGILACAVLDFAWPAQPSGRCTRPTPEV